MRVWRLSRAKHTKDLATAFNGEGAKQCGGRWNRSGTPVVYTSATLSLALLETLTHADLEDLPSDLVAVSVEVPEELFYKTVNADELPDNWRDIDPSPIELANEGDAWCGEGKVLVMSVPATVIPSERNYLINPLHKDFDQLSGFRVEPFQIDPRLGVDLA